MPDLAFDFDDLTIEEVEQIEEITGVSIDAIQEKGSAKGKTLRAIVFVVKRRTDPEFTIDAAGRLPVRDVEALLASTAPPTPAAS